MEEPRRLGDRYELGAVLGRGGMAEVHMARDIRLGRTVAVKTLRADLSRDPTFLARFRREAQSAASLNHPSIVAVFDTGEDYLGGIPIPYIIMEYVDGSTLRDLLHSGRQLLPERAMEITAGVLQALEYSHRHGIVHRDIKPANVMLTREGNVKVMDFGIARAVADSGMTMTQTAAVIGTAQYLSPEQAKGETVDARSDLYSTGCLLYELLTGRPPFTGDSPVAVAYQHVREEPQPPSVYDQDLTPSIDAIVLKSLAKARDDRYQSADDMRADLERALDNRPVAAPPVMGAGAYSAPTERIDPRTAALNQSTGVYAAPTGIYSPDDYGDDGDEPPRSRGAGDGGGGGKSGRAGYIVLAIACVAALIAAGVIAYALFNHDSGKQQQVPDLTNKTAHDAILLAKGQGFTATNGRCPTPSKTASKNTVATQNPKAGQSAKTNTTITFCLSTGAPTISVDPSLKNQSGNVVQTKLEQAGFDNVTSSPQNSSTVPVGNTIDVIVKGGGSALGKKESPSTPLVVEVSSGPGNLTIPDLTRQDPGTAQNELAGKGFTNVTISKQQVPSQTVPANTVLETQPGAGDSVPASTPIVIIVSAGQPPPATTTPPPPTTTAPPATPTPSSTPPTQPNGGVLGGPPGNGNG